MNIEGKQRCLQEQPVHKRLHILGGNGEDLGATVHMGFPVTRTHPK